MSILDRAEAFWLADRYSGTGDWLDLSGNSHTAALPGGSNDPTFRPLVNGRQYLWLPGLASNTVSTPHADIGAHTGNVSLSVDITLVDYTPASTQVLYSKFSGNDGIKLELTTATNVLTLTVGDGSATEALVSTVVTSLTDGTRHTILADWVDATSVIFSLDGTKLGDTVIGTKTLSDAAVAATIGLLEGKVHEASITVGGTVQAVPDFSRWADPAATQDDPQGNTWTINLDGTADQAQIVTRPGWWYDTDDFHEVTDAAGLDFAAGESFTLAIAMRSVDAVVGTPVAKRNGITAGNVGYQIRFSGGNMKFHFGDGNADEASGLVTPTVGAEHLLVGRRDVPSDKAQAFLDAVGGTAANDATTDSLANALVMRFGSESDGGGVFRGVIYGVGLWRESLTAAEIVSLQSEMLPTVRTEMMLGV